MIGAALDAQEYMTCLRLMLAEIDLNEVQTWSDLIYEAWENERFVFLCGNGGSGANATHMAEDLGKSLYDEPDLLDESKKRLKVMSLTDNTPWIMAVGNDLSYDEIFVQQLMNYGSKDDVLIAISGSGNSTNVLRAVDWANRHGLKTFGLTGLGGGKLVKLVQNELRIPVDDMGMIESAHLCLFHWVLDDLYGRVNGIGRYAANQRKTNGAATTNGHAKSAQRSGGGRRRARKP